MDKLVIDVIRDAQKWKPTAQSRGYGRWLDEEGNAHHLHGDLLSLVRNHQDELMIMYRHREELVAVTPEEDAHVEINVGIVTIRKEPMKKTNN